ncbi:MAG: hypothetical protein JWP78_3996 [Mucilaginibacter sp.]|nr:hypothetical protein [Mucilaginibacter sp.]
MAVKVFRGLADNRRTICTAPILIGTNKSITNSRAGRWSNRENFKLRHYRHERLIIELLMSFGGDLLSVCLAMMLTGVQRNKILLHLIISYSIHGK